MAKKQLKMNTDGTYSFTDPERIKTIDSQTNLGAGESSQKVDGSLFPSIQKVQSTLGTNWYPQQGLTDLENKVRKAEYVTAKAKADAQGFWGEMGGFIAQSVLGEVVLGTLEGAGYLLDLDHWYDTLSGGEGDWGNWFSDLMQSGQEGIRNIAPIYQDPGNENRSVWQNMLHGDGWWASNGVSMASTLSLLIPVAGTARAIGMAGKGLKGLSYAGKLGKVGKKGATLLDDLILSNSKASKILREGAGGVGKAIISRHLENHMEAAGVFQEKYQDLLNKGLSEEDAKKFASQGAALTYKLGWANLLTDIPQYLMLGKSFNANSASFITKLEKLKGKGAVGKAAATSLKYGKGLAQASSEGLEEFYQYIVAEEGKHLTDVNAGLIDPNETSFGDRLSEYLKDSEAWTSAFWGMAGGAVFHALGPKVMNLSKKVGGSLDSRMTQEQLALRELNKRQSTFIADTQNYYSAVEAGNERAADMAKTNRAFNLAVNAAEAGTLNNAIANIESLQDASPEEKAQWGLDEEFNDNIAELVKDVRAIGEQYEKNMNTYNPRSAASITHRQYLNKKLERSIPELEKKIADLSQEVPMINKLSPEGKKYYESKLARLGDLQALEAMEKHAKGSRKSKAAEIAEHIETLKEEVKLNLEIMNDISKDSLTAMDEAAIASLDGNAHKDLISAHASLKYAQSTLIDNTKELNHLTSDEYQKSLNAIDAGVDLELKKNVEEELKKQKNQRDEDILNGVEPDNVDPESPIDNIEELYNASQQDQSLLSKLPPETVKKIEEYAAKLNGASTSGESTEDTGEDTGETTEESGDTSDESKDQHKDTQDATFDFEEAETPSNSNYDVEFEKFYDEETLITQELNPLAWISENNKTYTGNTIDPDLVRALTDYLENPDISLEGVTARLDINGEFMTQFVPLDTDKGKLTREIINALKDGSILEKPELLKVIPIKAKLYKNGEPIVHLEKELSMTIHDPSHFTDKGQVSPNAEAQIDQILLIKKAAVQAILNGNTVEVSIQKKTGGFLQTEMEGQKFKENNVLNALGKTAEEIDLVVGDNGSTQGTTNSYINPDKTPNRDLAQFSSATPGAVYAVVTNALGKKVPLRLMTSKISYTEAGLVFDLYKDILTGKSTFESNISSEIIKKINTSKSDLVKQLGNYLPLGKTTYSELLNHLVFNGKKTISKDESRLFVDKGTLFFGLSKSNTVTLENIDDEATRRKFNKHLHLTRRRQIDINHLGNPKYVDYLLRNNVLTTNAKATESGNLFIQPLVTYNPDFKEISSTKIEEEAPTKPVPDYETDNTIAEDFGDDIAGMMASSTIIGQGWTPRTPEQDEKESNDADNWLNSDEDDGPGAFSLLTAEGETGIDISSEVERIKAILPSDIAIELQDSYIETLKKGSYATGLFKNGVIKLSRKAPRGTAYHEAFHAVFRTMLSPAQRESILSEARGEFVIFTDQDFKKLKETTGIENRTELMDLYYEEKLADAFASYSTQGDIKRDKLPKGIKGFFSKLMSWIKNVFNKKSTIDTLFNNINTGKYKNSKVDINRPMRKAFSLKEHPIFSADQVHEITQQLVYSAFTNVTDIENIHQQDLNNIMATLKTGWLNAKKSFEKGEITEDEYNTIEGNYKEVVDFSSGQATLKAFWIGAIDDYVENNLGLQRRKPKREQNLDDPLDSDDQNLDDLESKNFLKSSYEVSGKVSATTNVKFLIQLLPKIAKSENGDFTYKRSTTLGLPSFNDYSTTYNTLERILDGVVPTKENNFDALSEMYKKIQAEAVYKPELMLLLKRLNGLPKDKKAVEKIESKYPFLKKVTAIPVNTQNQFHFSFSRQRGNYISHLIEGQPGNMTSRLSGEDLDSKTSAVFGEWVENFANNFGVYENGELMYDSSRIADLERLKAILDTSTKNDIDNNTISGETTQAFKKALNLLGVNLDPNALRKILDRDVDFTKNIKSEYAYAMRNLVYQFAQATADIHAKSVQDKGRLNPATNLLADNQSFFKKILAETQSEFTTISGENTWLGPEGNPIWYYQDNNLMSKMVSRFKAGDLSELETLATGIYNKNSLFLKRLLEDSAQGIAFRNEFDLGLFGNYKEVSNSDKGDKASNLKSTEQYHDVVTKTLNGMLIGLAEADKGQQTYINIGRNNVESAEVRLSPKSGELYFSKDPKDKFSNPTNILMGYLKDELNRMTVAKKAFEDYEDPNNENVKLDDLLLYYHYTYDKEGNVIKGNAFNSFLFPNIDLQALGLAMADGTIVPLTDENFMHNKEVREYVSTQFMEAVKKDLQKAEDLGLVVKETKEGNTVYTNQLLDKDLIANKYQGDSAAAIADYTLNSIIGNVEQTKLFNGDPALYKVKYSFEKDGVTPKAWKDQDHFGDFMKRVPLTSASGKDFRIFTDETTGGVRTHYTSATIDNIEIPSSYFTDDKIEEVAKTLGATKDQVKEVFDGYKKVNQTDAQAWITLDVYKERMLGLGKWSGQHQDAFDKIKAGEDLSIGEVKLLAQPLKTVHAEIKPMKGGIMSVQYNKQSEAVLLPTLTKGTALDNLRVAMEAQDVDHVIVLDGKKVGAKAITKATDDNGNLLPSENIVLKPEHLAYTNLFLQQDLSSKGVKPTQVGSQGTKNVLGVLALEETYADGMTGLELYSQYHEGISKLSDKGRDKFLKKIGWSQEEGDFIIDMKTGALQLNIALKKEFEGELSDNHLEALDSKHDLDMFPIRQKLMNKLNSMLTKSSVKLKQKGAALVQLSNLGMIGTEVDLKDSIKDNIIWLKDPKEELKPMRVENGEVKPAQILMPYNEILKALQREMPEINVKDLSHEQVANMIEKSALQGYSYRIPNQGPSSNDAFEIVGILPAEAGDTIIAFSEITTKTGSDFDIDKAYVVLPNFRYSQKTNTIYADRYYPGQENTQEALENHRLNLIREMLLHPSAYLDVMAPLDAPQLKEFADKFYPNIKKSEDLSFFTGTSQLENKDTFDKAKALVGIIADHMSHHNLIMHEDLYLKGTYLGKGVVREEIEEPITESSSSDTYQYYGKRYTIKLNEEGEGIDVEGYKGKINKKATLLENYNSNKNIDPQNGKPFRYEAKPVKKIETGFIPKNEEQSSAIEGAREYLKDFKEKGGYYVISGKAGTGKTSIVGEILSHLPSDKYRNVIVTALSNKATSVLGDKTSHISGVTSGSLAKILGKKEDPETGKWVKADTKFGEFPPAYSADLIVVDEASMINEDQLEDLKDVGVPIIFLGDIGQLAPIRENDNKGVSPVFKGAIGESKLTERVRQGEQSPILPFADYFWENSQAKNPVVDPAKNRKDVVSEKGSLVFGDSSLVKETLPLYRKAISEGLPNLIKTVAYRRNTVNSVNKFIRENVLDNAETPFQKGELLIFNDPFLFHDGKVAVDNSTEVQIQTSEEDGVDKLGLRIFNLKVRYNKSNLYMKAVHPEDLPKYRQAISNAFVVARQLSGEARKKAFREAFDLKAKYPNLDYGYAITSHKSQGSTYNTVIVHENDINSVGPIDIKEKSRSIYTAITRASQTVFMIDGSATNQNNAKEAVNISLKTKQEEVKSPERIERNPSKSTSTEDIFQETTSSKGNIKETSLSNKTDEDGNTISTTLGMFMNAIVDAAKDPFIARMNINMITGNTMFMLARAGVSRDWLFAFAGQPILKRYVDLVNSKEGRFSEKIDPLDVIAEEYGLDTDELQTTAANYFYDSKNGLKVGDEVTITQEKLEGYLNTVNSGKELTAGQKFEQLKVLAQFLQWRNSAKDLSDLIKLSKVDVNGATKNVNRAQLAKNLYDKVISSGAIGNVKNLLGTEDSPKMIGTYFKNSVDTILEVLTGKFINTTPAIKNAIFKVAATAGYTELTTGEVAEQIVDTLANEMYTTYASTETTLLPPANVIKDILFGQDKSYGAERKLSISDRVKLAKNDPNLKDNLLISQLRASNPFGSRPGRVWLPNTQSVKQTKDKLYLAWAELFANENTRDLAEDLVTYSFLQSGFSTALGAFHEHIPMEYLVEKGFGEQLQKFKNKYLDGSTSAVTQSRVIAMYKNLHKDNKLVPVVNLRETKNLVSEELGHTFKKEEGFGITQSEVDYIAGFDTNGDVVFKPFLKVSRPEKDRHNQPTGNSIYDLYQLAGYNKDGHGIYLRTNKLGLYDKGNQVKEYFGDRKMSIFEENNIPADIKNVLDNPRFPAFNYSSKIIAPAYPFNKNRSVKSQQEEIVGKDHQASNVTLKEAQEQINFCLKM